MADSRSAAVETELVKETEVLVSRLSAQGASKLIRSGLEPGGKREPALPRSINRAVNAGAYARGSSALTNQGPFATEAFAPSLLSRLGVLLPCR